MTNKQIAQVCHEANRAYCLTLGDASQLSWESCPAWQMESAVNGVEFRITHPHAPVSTQHEQWMQEMLAAGWRHGETKDEEQKTHPCLVPFEQLPVEQQRKDKLFAAIVDALS